MWPITSVLVIVLCSLGSGIAQSQSPQQAPQIQSQQQSKSALKDKEKSNKEEKSSNSLTPIIPPVQSIPSRQEDHNNTQQSDDEASEFWTKFGHRVKVTDTLLVIFTALLFGATVSLWWSTRRLVKDAKDTAERQLRAYIGVSSGSVTFEVVNGETKAKARISMRNFGNTPAYGVISTGTVVTAREFTDEINSKQRPIRGVSTVFPKSGQRIIVPSNSKDFMISTEKTPPSIFIFGHIPYKDAFGHSRWTNFRFTAHWLDPHITRDSLADLAPCDEGNDAT